MFPVRFAGRLRVGDLEDVTFRGVDNSRFAALADPGQGRVIAQMDMPVDEPAGPVFVQDTIEALVSESVKKVQALFN